MTTAGSVGGRGALSSAAAARAPASPPVPTSGSVSAPGPEPVPEPEPEPRSGPCVGSGSPAVTCSAAEGVARTGRSAMTVACAGSGADSGGELAGAVCSPGAAGSGAGWVAAPGGDAGTHATVGSGVNGGSDGDPVGGTDDGSDDGSGGVGVDGCVGGAGGVEPAGVGAVGVRVTVLVGASRVKRHGIRDGSSIQDADVSVIAGCLRDGLGFPHVGTQWAATPDRLSVRRWPAGPQAGPGGSMTSHPQPSPPHLVAGSTTSSSGRRRWQTRGCRDANRRGGSSAPAR